MTVSPFFNLASAPASLASSIALDYELVRGTEARVLDELLPRVKQESVALNLAGVERIDAAGIAALITLYCTSVESGTEFAVTNPSPHVLELLKLVGLEAILVASCRPAGASRTRIGRSAA